MVGGVADSGIGAVGIEMAAELKMVQPQLKVTLVHSRDKLLSSEPLPDEVKDRALELLREAGVEVRMSTRLEGTEQVVDGEGNTCTRVTFVGGETMLADKVVMAVSRAMPTTNYLPGEVLDEEGYVRIHAKYGHPFEEPWAMLADLDTVSQCQPTPPIRQITLPLATLRSGRASSAAVPPCIWGIWRLTTFTS